MTNFEIQEKHEMNIETTVDGADAVVEADVDEEIVVVEDADGEMIVQVHAVLAVIVVEMNGLILQEEGTPSHVIMVTVDYPVAVEAVPVDEAVMNAVDIVVMATVDRVADEDKIAVEEMVVVAVVIAVVAVAVHI